MQTIEVTNLRDAQRARYALYSGYDQSIKLSDQTLSGRVLSVSPGPGVMPDKWIIKFKPSPEREPVLKKKSPFNRW